MLEAMTTRGPDSAGIAVYADRDPAPAGPEPGPEPGPGQELRYSLRSDETIDWDLLAKRIAAETAGISGSSRSGPTPPCSSRPPRRRRSWPPSAGPRPR